jgi:hypothetical protein
VPNCGKGLKIESAAILAAEVGRPYLKGQDFNPDNFSTEVQRLGLAERAQIYSQGKITIIQMNNITGQM